MKTICKVLLIVGIVGTWYLIYPIVLGVKAYKRLEDPISEKDYITWSLVTLIFVSPLAGIIMLDMKEDYTDEKISKRRDERISYSSKVVQPEGESGIFEAIEKLGKLRDGGLITEEEYSRKKTELLNKLSM